MKKIPNLVAIIDNSVNDEEKAQDIALDIKDAGFINKLELSNYGYIRMSEISVAINSIKTNDGLVSVKDLLDAIATHKYSEDKK